MTYAVLAPLGRLNWPHSKLAWLIINLLASASIPAWLNRYRPAVANGLTSIYSRSHMFTWQATVWILSLWLGAAALHTALAFGQLSVVALALMLPLLGVSRTSDGADRWPWCSARTIARSATRAGRDTQAAAYVYYRGVSIMYAAVAGGGVGDGFNSSLLVGCRTGERSLPSSPRRVTPTLQQRTYLHTS